LTINPISNLEIFNNAIRNWNAGDLDGYLNMYDPSVLLYRYASEPLDKAGVVARYKAAWANLSMPGKKGPLLTIDDVFEAGDRVVSRFTMSGVQSGSFMNFSPTGKRYDLPGITILKFRDGKVVQRWSCADRLKQLVQLGVLQLP
jgi:ketosteroid isomerase-like protein